LGKTIAGGKIAQRLPGPWYGLSLFCRAKADAISSPDMGPGA
jgi:hypothetical protein